MRTAATWICAVNSARPPINHPKRQMKRASGLAVRILGSGIGLMNLFQYVPCVVNFVARCVERVQWKCGCNGFNCVFWNSVLEAKYLPRCTRCEVIR